MKTDVLVQEYLHRWSEIYCWAITNSRDQPSDPALRGTGRMIGKPDSTTKWLHWSLNLMQIEGWVEDFGFLFVFSMIFLW